MVEDVDKVLKLEPASSENVIVEVVLSALANAHITPTDVGAAVALLTLGLNLAVALRRHPRKLLAFIVAYTVWFAIRSARHGATAHQELADRSWALWAATQDLVAAMFKLASVLIALVAPFAMDLFVALNLLWAQLSWQQRGTAAFVLFATYGVVATYQAVKKRVGKSGFNWRDALKRVLFQASFLVVGPALWIASGWVPNGPISLMLPGRGADAPTTSGESAYAASCWPAIITLIMSWVPAVLSLRAFRRQGRLARRPGANAAADASRAWLSYWCCWPLLAALDSQAVQGYADTVPELPRAFFVLLVFSQFWSGSVLLLALAKWTLSALRFVARRIAPCKSGPQSELVAEASRVVEAAKSPARQASLMWRLGAFVTRAGAWVRQKGRVAVGLCATAGLVVFVAIFYRILSLVTAVLTMAIFVAAAAESARVVERRDKEMYRVRLGFWIVAQLLEVATAVPVVGMFVALWEPLVLALSLVAGDSVVSYVVEPLAQSTMRTALLAGAHARAQMQVTTRGDQDRGANEDAATSSSSTGQDGKKREGANTLRRRHRKQSGEAGRVQKAEGSVVKDNDDTTKSQTFSSTSGSNLSEKVD